jgi:calcineurin-like phosphoesterase family protein
MGKIWFSADHHFGHYNIIKYCNRPFEGLEEMDNMLVYNWNTKVMPDDTVYYLGDFSMLKRSLYIDRLKGNIIFIRGSHDGDKDPYMMTIKPDGLVDEYGNQRSITLCHYSLRSWPLSHYASWHLFGHHHGNLEPYGLSFDVGVDCNNYHLVSLDHVKYKMNLLKPIVDYRDKKEK